MPRRITNICGVCGCRRYRQDWEEPDECPYCDGEVEDDNDEEEEE